MGRGDQKTRQGKVRRGTFGKTRPRQSKKDRAKRERAAAGGTNQPARGGAGSTAGAAGG